MCSLDMDKEQGSGGDGFVLIRLERLKLQYLQHGARTDKHIGMCIMFSVC